MAVLNRKAFACPVHQVRVHRHVTHAATAVKLDAVEPILSQAFDVPLVVDSPSARGLSLLDAAASIKVPEGGEETQTVKYTLLNVRFPLHILRSHTEHTATVRSKEVVGGGGLARVTHPPLFKPFEGP